MAAAVRWRDQERQGPRREVDGRCDKALTACSKGQNPAATAMLITGRLTHVAFDTYDAANADDVAGGGETIVSRSCTEHGNATACPV